MVGALDDRRMTKSHVTKLFKKMDKNCDGSLSLEEFIAGAREDEMFIKMLETSTPRYSMFSLVWCDSIKQSDDQINDWIR